MILKKFSPRQQNVQKFTKFTKMHENKRSKTISLRVFAHRKFEPLAANSRQKLIPPSQNGKLKNA